LWQLAELGLMRRLVGYSECEAIAIGLLLMQWFCPAYQQWWRSVFIECEMNKSMKTGLGGDIFRGVYQLSWQF